MSLRPLSLPPPIEGSLARKFIEALGEVGVLTVDTFKSIGRKPLEISSTIYQIEQLGLRSVAIVAVTSLFIGMVMCIQFAYGLKRFGGIEVIPSVIVLSFLRELGPTLTSVIVGVRIGSGMAAEVGAMNVTEQVDAIRALGADPAKKLVLPRVLAAIIAMPLLSMIADIVGILGAAFVCAVEFNMSPVFFFRKALEVTRLWDLFAGLLKTPVFGFLIAIIGCYFGLKTRDGTQGVGQSTTRTVVHVCISILVADFFLTRVLLAMGADG